jgi:glycosyltransferase involved in cell wall biosynthesis
MQQLENTEPLFLFDEEPGPYEKTMLEANPLAYRVLRGLPLHFLPFVQSRFRRMFPLDLFPTLCSYRPHIVFAPEYSIHTIICLFYCLLFRKKLVVWASLTELDDRISFRGQRTLRRLLQSKTDAFVCYSELAQRYLERKGVSREKCFKAENCTDVKYFLDHFHPRPRPEAPITLLYVGALVQEKGLHDFIAALSQLLHLSWRLHVAGDGEIAEQLRSSFPEEHRVTLLGVVPRHLLPEVYRQADVLVFPSHSDVWGHVIDEAMAMGCAVVASDRTVAACELIVNGRNGFIFETGNIQSLTSRLEGLLHNPQVIRAVGVSAHETMLNHTEANSVVGIEKAIAYVLGR